MSTGSVFGSAEAVGTVELEFHRFKPQNQTTIKHTIDCRMDILISGLKDDLEDELHVPAGEQIWIYNEKPLEGEKTLKFYGIQPGSVIVVKRVGES